MKPMLLFNMLDAVLSKHKDANSDSVVQTGNATQDLIQEEMENLDNMLIATPILPTTLTKPSSADSPSIYDTTILLWKPKRISGEANCLRFHISPHRRWLQVTNSAAVR